MAKEKLSKKKERHLVQEAARRHHSPEPLGESPLHVAENAMVTFSVRVSIDKAREIRRLAECRGISISDLLTNTVELLRDDVSAPTPPDASGIPDDAPGDNGHRPKVDRQSSALSSTPAASSPE